MILNYCCKCGGKLSHDMHGDKLRPKCIECGVSFYQNPTVSVGAIIISCGMVLLGKRNRSQQGLWCFPCGHVEWGEDVYEAVKRECEEETGLKIDVIDVYGVHSNYGQQYAGTGFDNPEQQSVIIWFLSKVVSGDLAPGDDISEVAFFSARELPKMAFPTHEIIMNKLKDNGLI